MRKREVNKQLREKKRQRLGLVASDGAHICKRQRSGLMVHICMSAGVHVSNVNKLNRV